MRSLSLRAKGLAKRIVPSCDRRHSGRSSGRQQTLIPRPSTPAQQSMRTIRDGAVIFFGNLREPSRERAHRPPAKTGPHDRWRTQPGCPMPHVVALLAVLRSVFRRRRPCSSRMRIRTAVIGTSSTPSGSGPAGNQPAPGRLARLRERTDGSRPLYARSPGARRAVPHRIVPLALEVPRHLAAAGTNRLRGPAGDGFDTHSAAAACGTISPDRWAMPFRVDLNPDQSGASVSTPSGDDPRCTITFVPRPEGWAPVGSVWSGEEPSEARREELVAQARGALHEALGTTNAPRGRPLSDGGSSQYLSA